LSEKTAAVIFLLEPVFATIFSIVTRLETASLHKIIGEGLILTSLYLSILSEYREK